MILVINKKTGHTITLSSKKQLLEKLESVGLQQKDVDSISKKSMSYIGDYIISRQSYNLIVVTNVGSPITSEAFTNPQQVIDFFKTESPLSDKQKDMLENSICFNHGKWLITFTTI